MRGPTKRVHTMMAALLIATCFSSTLAFTLRPLIAIPRPSTTLGATPAEAIKTLDSSQANTVSKIASSIPDLAVKDDLSWFTADDVKICGNTARLDGRDAPGPANVAWLSNLCIESTLSSLTIFNGPLTDVPHLISRCAVSDGGSSLSFFLDFRPRAYGAYDLRDEDGNYPGPDTLGRKAFEYSGARKDFDTKFGTDEVVKFLEETISSFEGATRAPDSTSEMEKVTRGPLVMDVTMPLSDKNVETIVAAREKAADFWLGWALDDSHAHRPGAPINSQYVYDSKYKINAYSALLNVYVDMFGKDDGAKLAAADSGPLDEAYVGGGS